MSIKAEIRKKLAGFTLDISLESQEGVIGLLGPSGCGKTMTIRCIAGIEQPDEGFIEINGRVVFDSKRKINIPARNRRTGIMFQNYALFPHMSVKRNLETGILKEAKTAREERIYKVCEMLQITEHLKKYPRELSGGQQQRVALGRILVMEPEIIMLDEPFSALDRSMRINLEDKICEVLKEFEKSVIYISHDPDEIYGYCDSVALFENGRIGAFGPKRAIFENPVWVGGGRLVGIRNIFEIEASGAERYISGCGVKLEGAGEGYAFVGVPSGAACISRGGDGVEASVLKVRPSPGSYGVTAVTDSGAEFAIECAEEFFEGERVRIKIDTSRVIMLKKDTGV